MGAFINFILFLERSIFIDPSSIFLEHGALPLETPLQTPNCKVKTNVFPNNLPFQFIYVRVKLWANHMG